MKGDNDPIPVLRSEIEIPGHYGRRAVPMLVSSADECSMNTVNEYEVAAPQAPSSKLLPCYLFPIKSSIQRDTNTTTC